MSSSNSKKGNKNTKAMFSIICLCIVSLGLIIYFSTATKTKNNAVVEPTTLVQTTEVQHAVTLKETTTEPTTAEDTTATTQPSTMPQNESNTPFKSYYSYPLGEAVLKGYSEELLYNNTMKDYRAHTAVDFSGNAGDTVMAINDGLVKDVYNDDMYGLCVEIDHGGNLVAKYCGLESSNVKAGDLVEIGNAIGTLGTVPCEAGDEAHLHFLTTIDTQSVNPLNVMGKTE